jgi:hypothetical protein
MHASRARRIVWSVWSGALLCTGCGLLIGEPFEGYSAAPPPDAGSGRDAHTLRKVLAPESSAAAADPRRASGKSTRAGAGGAAGDDGMRGASIAGDAGLDAGDTTQHGMIEDDGGAASGSGGSGGALGGEVLILPGDHCTGPIAAEVGFDDASSKPVGLSGYEVPQKPILEHTFAEGSPAAGALGLEATFTAPWQSIKLAWTFPVSTSLACISVRVKVSIQPDIVDLIGYPAGWFLWAIDDQNCFAQSEKNGGWSYDLDQAGVWYQLSASTNALVQAATCQDVAFEPKRIRTVGVGVTTSASNWHARWLVDTFRVY